RELRSETGRSRLLRRGVALHFTRRSDRTSTLDSTRYHGTTERRKSHRLRVRRGVGGVAGAEPRIGAGGMAAARQEGQRREDGLARGGARDRALLRLDRR